MDDVRGYFLGPSHDTIPAAVTTNYDIKMSSFKSSGNTPKTEGGKDKSVSNIQLSSVTLNDLAMTARESISLRKFKLNKRGLTMPIKYLLSLMF